MSGKAAHGGVIVAKSASMVYIENDEPRRKQRGIVVL